MPDELNPTTTTEAVAEIKPEAAAVVAKEGEASKGVEAATQEKDKENTTPTPKPPEVDHAKKSAELEAKIKSIQAGYKGTVDKMRLDNLALQTRLRELEETRFLKGVEDAGGDVEAAKRILTKERAIADREAQLEESRRVQDERAVELEEALRFVEATKIAAKYGVDVEKLHEKKTPVEMELAAALLSLEKVKADKVPVTQTDAPSAGSTKGIDVSKLGDIARLGMAALGKI